MNTQTVLLYGQSLLLSGVAAGLADVPGLEVARATTWADANRLLVKRIPDVLIFDLTGTCESHILPLLFKNPHLVMVGLDTEQNQAVLVSGHDSRALTLERVREIVEGGGPSQRDAERRRRGNAERDAPGGFGF
jgi:hypothetical protein